MDAQQWVALALAAVLLFWMVGAYNRLMKQRNAISRAWARVAEALQQRAAAAAPLADALALPLATEMGALQAWSAAQAVAARATTAMSALPTSAPHAADWMAAEAALGSASARVFALLEQRPDSTRDEAVAALAAAWRAGHGRLPFARQAFNDAVQAHNEALAVFPTRLLAPMYGFRPAGRL